MLLSLNINNEIVASEYAKTASTVGLNIIAWTFETPDSLLLSDEGGGWYYHSIKDGIQNKGDMIIALDVLNRDVGISALFTDFSATVSYYYNCYKSKM